MVSIKPIVLVEGKYDKIKLESVLDAAIFPTDGFSIFKDKEKLALFRRLAKPYGAVIATDSDAAGFQIRAYLKSALKGCMLYHLYIPDVFGKERRKTEASKEGKLGVEGIRPEVLLQALEKSGVLAEERPNSGITTADLFDLGFSGGQNSAQKRRLLCQSLNLPERIGTPALLDVLNLLLSREELYQTAKRLGVEE